MAKAIKALKAKGLATRTESRDRTRMVRSRARDIGANLRRRTGEAKDEVRAINAELVAIAVTAASEARRVTTNARRTLRELGHAAPRRLTALVDDLEITTSRVEQIAAQTKQRIDGITPDGATRLVSLHDPDARPIRKGRLGKPVEFGYKAQVVDNEDGIVVDHNVEMGNPPDAPMLAPAIERVAARTRTTPTAVTADRGYGETSIEDALTALGVATVVLPTKGKPNASRRAIEQRPAFQRLVKWRTGSEGRISCLKRDFGWNRTQLDGLKGARIWCGQGVFNHNLVKIAALVDAT